MFFAFVWRFGARRIDGRTVHIWDFLVLLFWGCLKWLRWVLFLWGGWDDVECFSIYRKGLACSLWGWMLVGLLICRKSLFAFGSHLPFFRIHTLGSFLLLLLIWSRSSLLCRSYYGLVFLGHSDCQLDAGAASLHIVMLILKYTKICWFNANGLRFLFMGWSWVLEVGRHRSRSWWSRICFVDM